MKSQRNMRRLCAMALLLGFAGATSTVWATIETTSPVYVGAATTIQGATGTGPNYTPKLTYFSQRMVQAPAYAGTISSVGANALTDTNATWSNGQFGPSGTQAYVEFNNGMMVDISNTSGSSQTLSLAGSLSGVAVAGDSYRIRPHWTIASLFGTNNEVGLKAGLNPSQADSIILQIPETQQTMSIFYFSNNTFKAWLRADFTAAANQIIYPEQGAIVRRVIAGDLNLFTCGPVKTGVTVAPIEVGYSLVGTLKSLSNLTLPALNIYTGNPATGLASGLNPSTADTLIVVQPDGSTKSYFYFKNSSFEGWYDSTFISASTTQLNAGSAFYIRRLATHGPFDWTIPGE